MITNGLRPPDYERDGIVLYCGDCLEILSQLPDGCVDAVVTDPPYGIEHTFGEINTRKGYAGKANGTRRLQFDWDGTGVIEGVANGLSLAFDCCRRSSACFVFVGFNSAERYANPARDHRFIVKPASWVKKHPPPAGFGNWWPSGFELAYYGYRNSPWFGDDDPKRCNVFVSDSYRNGQPGKVDHPTQKPLGLMKRIIAAIVPPNGNAIDPFMGSGTTGVACIKTGRKFIGIEKERKYFDIAVGRIEGAFESQSLFRQGDPPAA